MERSVGTLLVVVGVGLALVGVLVQAGALGWFGRLPGDLRIEGERTRVYVPITSMIIASIVLTLLVNVAGRWWR